MRWRIPSAATLSSISGYQRTNICSALSNINSFCTNIENSSSSQCKEPERLKQSSITFTNDDDFSELGEPVIKNGLSSLELMTEIPPSLEPTTGKFSTSLTEDDDFSELSAPAKRKQMASLKLMTKKPDHFMAFNPGPTKDMSPNKLRQGESFSGIKNILLSLDTLPNNVETNPGNPATASRTNKNNRDRSHINGKGVYQHVLRNSNEDRSHIKRNGVSGNSNSIAVQNVPTTVGLSTVVKAISKFGKVDTASMRKTSSGFHCEITFESAESRKRALMAGKVTVLGSELPVCPFSKPHLHVARHDRPKNVTIRVHGLSHDTTLDTMQSFYKSAGCLEGITIKQWPAVDAVFRVNAESDLKYLLDKLNRAIIDKRCCSAKILSPEDNAAVDLPIDEDTRDKMGLQVSGHLKELHNQLNLQSLYAEDLYNLHVAIMHLESQSGTSIHDS
ncbi:hypothetical protein Leryth_011201 [Lithospermum erythrorhizon]|nr:hypothetical protein Leryth_011201 [Lithospermum erythrorhizon]